MDTRRLAAELFALDAALIPHEWETVWAFKRRTLPLRAELAVLILSEK